MQINKILNKNQPKIHKGKTLATQSEEAILALRLKSVDRIACTLRMAFWAGKTRTLAKIYEDFSVPFTEVDRPGTSKDIEAVAALAIAQINKPKETLEVVKEITPEDTSDSNQDISILDKVPVEKVSHQRKAIRKILDLIDSGQKGILLDSGTGTGKTFILAGALRCLKERGLIPKKIFPILYLTKLTVIDQTKEVLEKFGLTERDVLVKNIELLRSELGKFFVDCKTTVTNGIEHQQWSWLGPMVPGIVVVDECHILMNEDSTQARIIAALQDCTNKPIILLSSATPFSNVAQTKYAAIVIGKDSNGLNITSNSFASWATNIAMPDKPTDFNVTAIKRATKALSHGIIAIRGVRFKHKGLNRVELIDFRTKEEENQYALTVEKYKRELELIERDLYDMDGRVLQMVLRLKFSQSAELIRHRTLAIRAHEKVQAGKAAVVAIRFKETGAALVKVLVRELGYKREDISMIWGGMGNLFDSDGNLKLRKIKMAHDRVDRLSETIINSFRDMNVIIQAVDYNGKVVKEIVCSKELEARNEIKNAGLRSVNLGDIVDLKLGAQKPEQRAVEIENFQTGKSKICIFTLAAGGVGLSLHHDKPELRPRSVDISPCDNEKQLAQAFGRVPRLTSLSDTPQSVLYYRGTVEEDLAANVGKKLHCLGSVTNTIEDWFSLIQKSPDYRKQSKAEVEATVVEMDHEIEVEDTTKEEEFE